MTSVPAAVRLFLESGGSPPILQIPQSAPRPFQSAGLLFFHYIYKMTSSMEKQTRILITSKNGVCYVCDREGNVTLSFVARSLKEIIILRDRRTFLLRPLSSTAPDILLKFNDEKENPLGASLQYFVTLLLYFHPELPVNFEEDMAKSERVQFALRPRTQCMKNLAVMQGLLDLDKELKVEKEKRVAEKREFEARMSLITQPQALEREQSPAGAPWRWTIHLGEFEQIENVPLALCLRNVSVSIVTQDSNEGLVSQLAFRRCLFALSTERMAFFWSVTSDRLWLQFDLKEMTTLEGVAEEESPSYTPNSRSQKSVCRYGRLTLSSESNHRKVIVVLDASMAVNDADWECSNFTYVEAVVRGMNPKNLQDTTTLGDESFRDSSESSGEQPALLRLLRIAPNNPMRANQVCVTNEHLRAEIAALQAKLCSLTQCDPLIVAAQNSKLAADAIHRSNRFLSPTATECSHRNLAILIGKICTESLQRRALATLNQSASRSLATR